MNNRLREIVNCKTNGKQQEFADVLGWSPQYLARLLHGFSFGLKPVLELLKTFPDINARWLLLGEGHMLTTDKVGQLRQGTLSHIQAVLDIERFIPVMSPEELSEYEQMIAGHKRPEFSPVVRLEWLQRTYEKGQPSANRVDKAIEQSDEICRQQTANKS